MVAIEPSTGKILAMVSTPTFDPSLLARHDLESVQEDYGRLDDDPDKPMFNRAIQEVYPPGSTFKLVTAAAALSSRRLRRRHQGPGRLRARPAADRPHAAQQRRQATAAASGSP